MSNKAIIFLFIFKTFLVNSQEILPYVENFSKSNHDGDSQIWNLCQGSDKSLYFANNHFLLRYNGVKWEKYSLPNKTIIRSVFEDDDKIFTGSYNEFGFWKRENCVLKYYSLSNNKSFFLQNSNNEEIWKIFKFNQKIYFQSFNEIYIYDFKSIKKVKIPFQISYCFPVDNKLYFASVANGIYEYSNDIFVESKALGLLKNNIIHHIEKKSDLTYFFTKGNGIFIEQQGVLSSWKNDLNNKLKSELIISARFINNDLLAIGTSFNGLYLVDFKQNTIKNFNKSNSLQNNSVLSINVDSENDLWLGLDNGIAHIEINSPYNLFSDPTGILGSLYAIQQINSDFYLGSNHGLFLLSGNKLNFIKGTQGQVWDIFSIKNQLIVGHNDGSFIGNNFNFKKINQVSGGWKFLKSKFDNVCFQANYSGIVIYQNNNFLQPKIVKGLTKPIKNIIQTSQFELWATDNYKGLYKIIFNKNYDVISINNITETNNFKNDYNVKMIQFNDQLLFYIDDNWFQFNSKSGKLKKNTVFNRNFKNISDVVSINTASFLILKDNLFYIVRKTNNDFILDLIPEKYYLGKIINQETKVFSFDNNFYINLDYGFLNIKTFIKNNEKVSIKIEAFYNNKPILNSTKIKFDQPVTLEIISTYFGNKHQELYYTFNSEGIYKTIKDNKIVLNNLSSGKQKINIYQNINSKKILITDYVFTVDRQWYFSDLMILIYILVFSGILFLYYRWNKIRYLEKFKLHEEELKHQNQINRLAFEAENKEKLQNYEKHILELQVQSKASEVAEKSLSIAKQTDMIDTIQKALEELNDVDKLKSNIQKTIKQNSYNKREWQSFENNLFKSNEDFLNQLNIKFPKLSSRDKKLCIYLKMNLTSKEMAPLMNISYRSIELQRYRLRKKLEIDTEINLSQFMNSFQNLNIKD